LTFIYYSTLMLPVNRKIKEIAKSLCGKFEAGVSPEYPRDARLVLASERLL